MQRRTLTLLLCTLFFAQAMAQNSLIIDGYAFEEDNRGFIKDAKVTLFTSSMIEKGSTMTDEDGHFVFETSADQDYIVRVEHKLYFRKEQKVSPSDANEAHKVFLKMKMERKPGYIFDVTLAEPRPAPDTPAPSVEGATIEIYNNTRDTMEWVAENYPSPYFKFTFEQGNYYTIMISKEGYITKQIDAHVNIDGCIICIEGVNTVQPGVVDNLTAGHQKGTLLANIELKPIKIGQKIEVGDLHYASAHWKVTPSMYDELQKVINLMNNNPSLILELRSHTDCKGDADYNAKLSRKRAKAAVDYILKNSDIDPYRLKPVGLGETQPLKKCKNCATCPEHILAANRRTELKITGLLSKKHVKLPLTKMKEKEKMDRMIQDVMFGEQIVVPEGGELPDELKKTIEKDKEAEAQTATAPEKINENASAPEKELVEEKKTRKDVVVPEKKKDDAIAVKKPSEPVQSQLEEETVEPVEVEKERAEAKKRTASVKSEVDAHTVKRPSEPKQSQFEEEAVESVEAEDKLSEAEKRAASVFKGHIPKGKDPEVSEHLPGQVESKIEKETSTTPTSGEKEKHPKIVKDVNLSDLDIARTIAAVPDNYSGYKIEIKRSHFELPASDKIFSDYGDITYYKTSGGRYEYLTGDFATRKVADLALEYVRKKYPKAKLRLFKNGKPVD